MKLSDLFGGFIFLYYLCNVNKKHISYVSNTYHINRRYK